MQFHFYMLPLLVQDIDDKRWSLSCFNKFFKNLYKTILNAIIIKYFAKYKNRYHKGTLDNPRYVGRVIHAIDLKCQLTIKLLNLFFKRTINGLIFFL